MLSRNAPNPSASVTARVWLAGRCRLAIPWRSVNGQDGRTTRRANAISNEAAPYNTMPAPAMAMLTHAPSRRPPMRTAVIATMLATSSTSTAMRIGSFHSRGTAALSVLRRSACRGEIRRSASSGRSANTSETHTPVDSPTSNARHSIETDTSSGRKSPTTLGKPYCTATPSAAPADAPTKPMAAACTTYNPSTWRLVAPRQRSIATVSIFDATKALIPLATPIPPSSNATSPMMLRKFARRETVPVRSCSVSVTVRTRMRARGVAVSWLLSALCTAAVSKLSSSASSACACPRDGAPSRASRSSRWALRGSRRRRMTFARAAASRGPDCDGGICNTAS